MYHAKQLPSLLSPKEMLSKILKVTASFFFISNVFYFIVLNIEYAAFPLIFPSTIDMY